MMLRRNIDVEKYKKTTIIKNIKNGFFGDSKEDIANHINDIMNDLFEEISKLKDKNALFINELNKLLIERHDEYTHKINKNLYTKNLEMEDYVLIEQLRSIKKKVENYEK